MNFCDCDKQFDMTTHFINCQHDQSIKLKLKHLVT